VFLERVVDICAHKLGHCSDEMRLRNYHSSGRVPYTTQMAASTIPATIPRCCSGEGADWLEDWKKKQAAARAAGCLDGESESALR